MTWHRAADDAARLVHNESGAPPGDDPGSRPRRPDSVVQPLPSPSKQAAGCIDLIDDLAARLAEITGYDAVSLQPNAGSQGEYAGLLAIRAYHRSRGDLERTVCLIPSNAHGTNPASAVMAGLKVVVVACDENGDIDGADLRRKRRAAQRSIGRAYGDATRPRTVFSRNRSRRSAGLIHGCGGQVYMDGANLNAQVGLARPAEIGADVCHLNLHKTFCMPHGAAVQVWAP